MYKFKYLLTLLILCSLTIYGQDGTKYQLGKSLEDNNRLAQQIGIYDLSEADALNMEISVWGSAARTGKFIVPVGTSVYDILTIAQPSQSAHLDDIRIYRVLPDSTRTFIRVYYDDLLWEDEIIKKKEESVELLAGDTIVLPGSPRFFFRDYLSLGITIFSAMVSIVTFIITLSNK